MTLTVDRKLIGDPDMLEWGVAAEEREEGVGAYENASDECPDESRGAYRLMKPWR